MEHLPGHPHLPPGAEPGPQSRRRRARRRLLKPVLGGAAVLLVGLLAFLALVAGSAGVGPSPALLAGLAAGALLCGGAYVLLRGRLSRTDRSLAVTVSPQHARRGETLRAALAAGGDGAEIELGLVCRIVYDIESRADDSPQRVTKTATVLEHWAPASLGEADLAIPADGPYSYEGSAVSFAWAVHARRAGARASSRPAPVWVSA